MTTEPLPDRQALREAFDHEIYSSSGTTLRFGSLFYDCDVFPAEKRILVVFIRHFFCGNCQEYVRRLSSIESPFHPSQKSLHASMSVASTTNFSKPASRTLPTVIIVGPGQPSLIASYKNVTQCPYDIYADPSLRLYELLGMYRTLSLGHKAPGYIEHSLLSGALKSAWQIVRRVGNGDAMNGGDWDINGGEFLFVRSASGRPSMGLKSTSPSRSRSRSRSRSAQSQDWDVSWCHRMLNSRDHTEIINLQYHACLPELSSRANSRTSSPAPLKSILVNGGRAHSKTPSGSYSTERLGSCPGPDVPKSREEVIASQRFSRPHSRSHSRPKSQHQRRPRSTSTGSLVNKTENQSHRRVWSVLSNSSTSRLDSVASPISELAEEDFKPRKSFSATIAERASFGGLIKRPRSSSSPQRTETSPVVVNAIREAGRNTLSESTYGSTASKSSMTPDANHNPGNNNDFKQTFNDLILPSSSSSPTTTPSPPSDRIAPKSQRTHARSRTFSFSRPSFPLRRRAASQIEMSEDGVMFVDGVEFVNVISIKARIEASSARDQRRERADSGLGMEVETRHDKAAPRKESNAEVPDSKKKYSVLTTLPELSAVTRQGIGELNAA
ncbi:hypothetical protein AYO21_07748 [Fonsecaea monophora]|uniref:Uncharacterized protein n=1 Tax=Fonsecaea monophora TaxID=254056 RepID=A0A177F2H4_9EURO|nr:hypothetical protein AYO21_07748 [Fonsecaea monophora]KAH0828512.1 hypothetical protein FOPE_01534 [Fonsecaea pedrosoi]OAG38026.1 hypothetical protein AYO21_07748 [Fonsecaea monophora]